MPAWTDAGDLMERAMRWAKTLTVVGAHAEGEVGRVVTGGVLDVPGATMRDKLRFLNEQADDLRRFCMFEPRGCAQMTANLLLPPVTAGADAAFIPMQADRSHAMSGSNAMCVVVVLLETGMLAMREPETVVVLDTAAGTVEARAACADGRVDGVALKFFPSFCEHIDHPLEVPGLGTIPVDVAFGGVYYVLVDADSLGIAIGPPSARELVDAGNRIKAAAQEQIVVKHPHVPEFDHVEFVMFTGASAAAGRYRNATIMPPGRLDRSPCGTGTAARLAAMHARGLVEAGREYEMCSAIDSRFVAKILEVTEVGGYPAVVPSITGRAWIHGFFQFGIDPCDPFGTGFTLADTWGTGMEHAIP